MVQTTWHEDLVDRLSRAAVGHSVCEVAHRTGMNHETVRRYMMTGRVPALFICEFCRAFEVEPNWLLMGQGVMRPRQSKKDPSAFRRNGSHEEERGER